MKNLILAAGFFAAAFTIASACKLKKSTRIMTFRELFDDLIDYFWSKDSPRGWFVDEIRRKLNSKLDKMLTRELFSQYKRFPMGAEREQARKARLDHNLCR